MNNIKNKLITKKFVETVVNEIIGGDPVFKVNDLSYYQTPFIQKSFCAIEEDNSDSDNYASIKFNSYDLMNNERLEFLGDKVIDFITTEFLFDKFPGKDEGFLTKLKSRMVKKESLAKLGKNLNFKDYMLISTHVERNDGRNNARFLEDIFESFVGGLYKDQHSDINIARKFVLGVYSKFIVIDDLININDNFKDSLLRYFHSKGYGHPVYSFLFSTGNMSSKEFTTAIFVEKELLDNSDSTQNNLLNIIKKENPECYSELLKKTKTHTLVSIGKAETKKASQQVCSKNCLLSMNVSLNY